MMMTGKKKKKDMSLPPSSLMIYGTKDISMGMKIGAGGFADVYKAIFRNSESPALKGLVVREREMRIRVAAVLVRGRFCFRISQV